MFRTALIALAMLAGLADVPASAQPADRGPRGAQIPDRVDRAAGRLDRIPDVADRVPDRLDRVDRIGGIPDRAVPGDRVDGLSNPASRAIPDRAGMPPSLPSLATRRAAAADRLLQLPDGAWALRNEILALAPAAVLDEAALGDGFRVLRRDRLDALDLELLAIGVPDGADMTAALESLRARAPEVRFELNHLFEPSGEPAEHPVAGLEGGKGGAAAEELSVGLVDTAIDPDHPLLRRARIESASFAEIGPGEDTAHGTATASLLVGEGDEGETSFRGALPGARLLAADVFGDDITGGSAESLIRALAWLVDRDVTAIAMPLTGPANVLVEIALGRLHERGLLIVAPVGNGGPILPVAFPAAYDSVIAVTATDRDGKVFLNAQRGPEVMFAAIGDGVPAAAAGGGTLPVSGTSFAVPEVTALLARLSGAGTPSRQASARAVDTLAGLARDLGVPGRDPVYGHGWISHGEDGRPSAMTRAAPPPGR